jgi:hypothetical protein
MTCIVGLVDDERVVMGADSFGGADGCPGSTLKNPKIVRIGGLAIGYTSSYRLGQLLQYGFSPPAVDDRDIEEYLVSRFVPSLRAHLKEHGWSTVENGREEAGGLLIACRGRLFRMQAEYEMIEEACGYGAVGCGATLAFGSLHTSGVAVTEGADWLTPEVRVRLALDASAAFDQHVAAPYTVMAVC